MLFNGHRQTHSLIPLTMLKVLCGVMNESVIHLYHDPIGSYAGVWLDIPDKSLKCKLCNGPTLKTHVKPCSYTASIFTIFFVRIVPVLYFSPFLFHSTLLSTISDTLAETTSLCR